MTGAYAAEPLPSWSALVAVYQSVLHDVVAALDERAGMDSGVFSALAYLARSGPRQALPMRELQALMHPRYSQPGFSRLVARMETDGLVERRPDPSDGRAVTIVMTRLGRDQFRRADAVYTDALERSFGCCLGDEEHRRLAVTLERVMARRGDRR